MRRFVSRIPKPVKRAGADRYLFFTLLSFAGSVIVTRAFLALTGYPQIGGATLHIAHVLWGGLLLFVAALLPLILANRWVYYLTGVLSGLGVGLFIDEVGKFITQSNDYFYPAAAPIIYACFLLTVLVYSRVRRPPSQDARAELYRALDGLEEVLDHDLSLREQAELTAQLRVVAGRAEHPDLRRLATVLLDFIGSEGVTLAPETPGAWQRWAMRWQRWEERWISRPVLRVVLVASLGVVAAAGLINLFSWVSVATFSETGLEAMRDLLAITGYVTGPGTLVGFLVRLMLEGTVSVMLLACLWHFVLGKEARATTLGSAALLLSLTTANLLVFYFDQFRAVFTTAVQFALLLGLTYYRQRYVEPA